MFEFLRVMFVMPFSENCESWVPFTARHSQSTMVELEETELRLSVKSLLTKVYLAKSPVLIYKLDFIGILQVFFI